MTPRFSPIQWFPWGMKLTKLYINARAGYVNMKLHTYVMFKWIIWFLWYVYLLFCFDMYPCSLCSFWFIITLLMAIWCVYTIQEQPCCLRYTSMLFWRWCKCCVMRAEDVLSSVRFLEATKIAWTSWAIKLKEMKKTHEGSHIFLIIISEF